MYIHTYVYMYLVDLELIEIFFSVPIPLHCAENCLEKFHNWTTNKWQKSLFWSLSCPRDNLELVRGRVCICSKKSISWLQIEDLHTVCIFFSTNLTVTHFCVGLVMTEQHGVRHVGMKLLRNCYMSCLVCIVPTSSFCFCHILVLYLFRYVCF